jgi:hypothetical protein
MSCGREIGAFFEVLNEVCQRQTSRMDWGALALVLAVLTIAIVGIVAVTKIGITLTRRPRKPTRVRHAKGEYQPPEPPEGRYWG